MNDSTNAIEDLENELKSRSQAETAVECVVLLAINITALIGNVLVCCVFYKSPRMRTATNFHILALAISDIAMATVCMPLVVGVLVTGEWKYPSFICGIHGFAALFLSFLSLQIMTLTALNRYVRITRAWAYRRWFTKKCTLLSVVFAAGIALILVGFPLVVGWGELVYHPGKITCVLILRERAADLAYSSVLGLFLVIIPFTIIAFCYSKVYQKVQKHRRMFSVASRSWRSEATGSGQCGPNASLSVEEIKITTTLFAIVLGFTFCWIPVISIEFAESLRGNFSLPRPLYLLYVCLVSLSAAINPIIYGIMNTTFRTEYGKIIRSAMRIKGVTIFRRKENGNFDSKL